MESRDVFSQRELEEALGRPGLIPVCAGDGAFTVAGDHFVRAADFARLQVRDDVSVDAGGSATVVANGRNHVTARHAVTVEADDSTTVIAHDRARVHADGRVRVVAVGDSTVTAAGDSFIVAMGRATVSALGRCRVRAVLRARVILSGEARGWVWGRAVAEAADRATVTAWGSASVFAQDSATVEALESAVVSASGTATVRAFGHAITRARGRARVAAAPAGAEPATAAEWCTYYGVPVDDGVAILYKAVDDDFRSYHGTSYRPGSVPVAADWDGGEQECGGGLHFSPRPTFALAVPTDRMRFVACPVRLTDIAFHPDGVYRAKVKARGVCAPVYEVDEDGSAIAASVPSA